jgi:ornithine carbamoyltransferase
MHDLLRVADLDAAELLELLELAAAAKADRSAFSQAGAGRTAAVLFEKPSLRTRFSVEGALARIGAHPIGAYDREVGLGSRESLEDAGAVLSRYTDVIVIRTFAHERVERLARAASVPVINALTDAHHPLQALADLQTVTESCCAGDARALKDVRIGFIGDGNNVAASLIEACTLVGASVAIGCPPGQEPDDAVLSWAAEHAGVVKVTNDAGAAVKDADVVYTDVWASMGQEDEADARKKLFAPYRVSAELMSAAAPDAIFLHCLPAHRGEEVTAEVIDGGASRVFDQAENRLHTSLAVFVRLFEGV